MEIGRHGSNVCITADQWDTATDQNTFTKMTTSLLVALFPEDVLLQSNFRGGKSKIAKNADHYDALDERRIRALECMNNRHWLIYLVPIESVKS